MVCPGSGICIFGRDCVFLLFWLIARHHFTEYRVYLSVMSQQLVYFSVKLLHWNMNNLKVLMILVFTNVRVDIFSVYLNINSIFKYKFREINSKQTWCTRKIPGNIYPKTLYRLGVLICDVGRLSVLFDLSLIYKVHHQLHTKYAYSQLSI